MSNYIEREGRGPFAMVYATVYDGPLKGRPYALSVYIALWLYSDGSSRKAYPSITTLQERTGLSRHTVLDAIAYLKNVGLLRVTQEFTPGGRPHNVYTVIEWSDISAPDAPVHETTDIGAGDALILVHEMHCNKNHLNKNHITRKNKQKEKSVLTDEQVQRFKSVYPQRLGTKNWPKAIELLHKNAEHYDEIVRGAIAYGKTVEVGTQWVKAPYNFLRDGIWREYTDSPQTPLTVKTKLTPEELAERAKNNPEDWSDVMPSLKAISPGGVWRRPKRSLEELFELARQQEIAGTT